jgi:sugar fermentation stimulation protein A
VNTALPNKLARLALEKGALGGFPKGGRVFAEVTRGKSRLDLLHVSENGRKIYVEVKNCTLAVDGVAYFPDAVSKRAAKHLAELDDIIASGSGGVLLVLVQRQNARVFSPADHIDPEWGKALRKSAGKGLTLMVREVRLSLSEAALGGIIPAEL